MRSLMLLATTAVLAAPAAFACDHDKAASAAGHGAAAKVATAGHDCPHAAMAAGEMKPCCRALHATEAALAGQGGGAVLANTVAAVAHEGSAHDCPYAALRDAAAHGCKMSDEALKTAQELKASGKVVCSHCDLKKTETCASVFLATGSNSYVKLCGEGMSEQLMKITRHGEVGVTVHGHVISAAGDKVLCVDGFSVGTI